MTVATPAPHEGKPAGKRPRLFAARAVYYAHLLIVVFTLIGFAVPVRAAWMAHAVLIPATRLHWLLNGGKCVLTTWERRLRGDESEHESGAFVRELVQRLTGWLPSEPLTAWAIALWMWGGFVISLLRILL